MTRYIIISVCCLIYFFSSAQPVQSIISSLPTDQAKADTLLYFSNRYLMRAKFDSANFCLQQGLALAQKIGDNKLLAKYYLEHGKSLFFNGDKQEAMNWLNKAKPFLPGLSPGLQNSFLVMKAKLFKQLNQPDSAFHYLKRSEDFNNRTDPYRNWTTYVEMGIMFDNNDDFENAEKYYKAAYDMTKAKGVRMDFGVAIAYYIGLFQKFGNASMFGKLLKENDEFIRAGKKDYTKDPVHSMMFIDWGKTPLAKKVEFMNGVKNDLLKQGFTRPALFANNYIVSFYEKNKQFDEALKYSKENIEMSAKENDIENLYINTKIAYRLYKQAGNANEATTTAEKLLAIKDSMLRMQQREMVLDIETKYGTEKKAQEIALLTSRNDYAALQLENELEIKKRLQLENLLKDSAVNREVASNELLRTENDLKKTELEKQVLLKTALDQESRAKSNELSKERNIRLLLIGAASLLAFAGLVILVLYRKQKAKNNLIQKQADDLSILMKEIHHRVKNNLQIISSLLDLQSNTISDVQASEAVKEGKNRVQSMALIHQNLYSEGNIKGIRAKEYVMNLLQSLCNSYNITNDKVSVTTQIDDLNIDVDTMIPLGLVLNELVSNSLKYAFKETGDGQLNVVLKQAGNHLKLRVSDNGIGFPADINTAGSNKSFGLKMINAFAKKLKAKLSIYNQDGAVVEMQIAKYKIA